ncbi:DNA translocase FtsK [Pedosphaera parvula]|uniref:Cell divisionFtsK/SpoIIIE n=1 Tax=Pedosphaera parvula (strain Ellin514) TaxID=320771 RepID=B9XHF2_PEDPL|nr:DNA translocase FtsK [Pedosphaera parvula]EEF60787.1 cell divisionFtsK/SpoIIIE [Pedosphaera parvula Ellin514]
MARKASPEKASTHRGFNDIIGIVLVGFAVLLLVALISYNPRDVSANATPPNHPAHNAIGPFGAWLSYIFLLTFGVSSYVLPFLFVFVGLGCFLEMLSYVRRRWAWTLVIFFCCIGMFDLYRDYLEGLHKKLRVMPGGIIGVNLNNYIFNYFGTTGATIIFMMLYFISILFLTNFQLGAWIRALVNRDKTANGKVSGLATSPAGLTDDEKALEKKARELEKQARKLQEQVDKSKAKEAKELAKDAAKADAKAEPMAAPIGADLKPLPEPTVRDLSVPQAKPLNGKPKKPTAPEPLKSPEPPADAVVISARELSAASSADVLGRKAPTKSEEPAATEMAARVNGEGQPVVDGASAEPEVNIAPAALPSAPKPKLQPKKPKPITVAATPMIGNYQLPPMDFLQYPDMTLKPTESKEELMANARLMQQTLAQFDIEVQLGDITKGPTITRYELHPAPGVKLEKIAGLNNNIAAALKAERINILAPIPGKSSVGVEVPNAVKTKVIMRDLLESEEWANSKARIPLALGKDVYGHPIIADLAEMPHCLIAGSTGSGKSVCINSIIASLLYKFSPDQLRFVMIDPKVVELQQYNALPHLVVPVVTDPKKVILALRWVVNEMEKRYQIFAKVGVRNIKSFNERPKNKPIPTPEPELPLMAKKEKVEPGADGFAVEVDEQIVVPREDDIVIPEKLSYIVVIIDELADLMLVAPADVEMAIARITQMARAAGIHCIVATQRPSVDVITGVIKANIPARIAFQVAAKVDSRTILDAMGADKLLGKGDMLYLPPGSARLIRAQGVLITDQEIQHCVDFIAKQGKPSYEVEIHKQLQKPVSSFDGGGGGESGIDEDEDLIQQCIEVIRSEQKASVSLMQRRLRLGYTRAARIMDELEDRGIVGPSKGAEPRDILIDLDGEGADGGGEASHGK